jgi:adaptin ear-binding coat-associated protein 1/2
MSVALVFAEAPYDHTGTSVEAVLDSSRYFVLRVEAEGKRAYIGVGFPERPEAFDFSS